MDLLLQYFGGPIGVAGLTVAASATALLIMQRSRPVPLAVDLKAQSVPAKGIPYAYKSPLCENDVLLETMDPEVQTMYDVICRGARLSNNGRCAGWRPSENEEYSWLSYSDVLTRASNFGSGLMELNLDPSPKVDTVLIGVYCQNKPEYLIAEVAFTMYSCASVPLYDTLGPNACTYIINQADIQCVICDKNEKVTALLERAGDTKTLRTIIVMDEVSDENLAEAKRLNINMLQFADIEENGVKNPLAIKPVKPDDLYLICYTSGTTGNPKGAMLTHKNLVATISACLVTLGKSIDVGPDDIVISYLPMAHGYERVMQGALLFVGGSIGFFRGDVKKLVDDIKVLKPTIFPSVPRLLNRVYDQVMNTVSQSNVKKCLFNLACRFKQRDLQRQVISKNTIWDKLVFKKVQETLGGNVRLLISGSAPLSVKVLSFLRCATGCVVLEGYGQTESGAVSSLSAVGDAEPGHVGFPLPCNYIKLMDVPEMNYFAKDKRGEVCIKGTNVFKGYLGDPEKTAEALDSEGWLHTGDIGEWTENMTIKLFDRKKHIFKLAQGEYIAPEKIENVYMRAPLVAQAFVHGDSLQAFLVAVVVPDFDPFSKWVNENLGLSGSVKKLCQDENVNEAVLQQMVNIGRKAGLKSFEQVKGVYLHHELFSVENGLLTPTFKSKRNDLKKFFEKEIADLYKKHGAASL